MSFNKQFVNKASNRLTDTMVNLLIYMLVGVNVYNNYHHNDIV